MNIGYERKSTRRQKSDLQTDSLNESECEIVFSDTWTGANMKRPDFERMMAMLRKGDKVIVWKLDRLGRSLKDLIQIVEDLHEKGVHFKCQYMDFDTTTAAGMMFFQVMGAMAEFELSLIHERTMAGLAAARGRGRVGGRPKGLLKENKSKPTLVKSLYKEGDKSVVEIMSLLGIKSKATFYKFLNLKDE